MSTSEQVRAILGGTIEAYRNDPAYRDRPDVHNELERIGYRLNQPIRIALAGTLKAGKSTLVNALVGEDIAPTDATEATRIVTWFRHGPIPKVTANHRGGRRTNVPIARDGGLVGGWAGALGVIGVASGADEIGAGRIDAMLSAKDVAIRFTNEMDKTGICQAVVPVSGLLALTARTLRQSEFVALEKLAGVDAAELTKAMLSVDRFAREDSY